MEPISNVDRVVLLLKQRLEQRSRSQRKASDSARHTNAQNKRPQGIAALAAIADVDERQLRRTLVQTLLADQLGSDLVNDAQFQQLVSRVTDAIEGDDKAAKLLTRVLTDARAR